MWILGLPGEGKDSHDLVAGEIPLLLNDSQPSLMRLVTVLQLSCQRLCTQLLWKCLTGPALGRTVKDTLRRRCRKKSGRGLEASQQVSCRQEAGKGVTFSQMAPHLELHLLTCFIVNLPLSAYQFVICWFHKDGSSILLPAVSSIFLCLVGRRHSG